MAIVRTSLSCRAAQIDGEDALVEGGRATSMPSASTNHPLELPRRDAAMQIDALRLLGLAAADDQLVVLELDAQIVGQRKPATASVMRKPLSPTCSML